MIDKNHPEECWISLVLRIAAALVFGAAAYFKFSNGLGVYSAGMTGLLKNTPLPGFFLTLYINVLPFAEALIAVWLLAGVKLRAAWIFTAFVLISLGVGMMLLKNFSVVSQNYVYVVIACWGIYLSKYDKCNLMSCCGKK